MNDRILKESTCRVALAALLHDLGKFAERARIPEAEEKDIEGNTRRDLNVPHYCPRFDGHATHIHAAYTAIAIDFLERYVPDLVGEDMTPFAPWKDKDVDDSIINAAAKHHRPETYLQWIIATADRLSSGFEREEFEKYNKSPDRTETKKNHYTARQLTLFEQIQLNVRGSKELFFNYRYPLMALSPKGIFPVRSDECETDDNATAQEEYRRLWKQFVEGLEDIPRSHCTNLDLWLDHFDSLWLCFAHAIPAATAFNVKPEVSLYDHSKATASLAAALWRYHHDRGDDTKDVVTSTKDRSDWGDSKFLLVQGDFSGIQDFIFSTGGETQRQAAKLLRGRSFYVSLLADCAALKVLDALALPSTSQVINAAGKFLIVAPNIESAHEALERVQKELDTWFLEHTYGQAGIVLSWLPAACNDFLKGNDKTSPYTKLRKRLFEQLEEAKLKRLNLCDASPPAPVFKDFLDSFDNTKGVCDIDGRSPAIRQLEGGKDIWVSDLAFDQIMTGKWLATHERLLVTRERVQPLDGSQVLHGLLLPIFGYHILFTGSEDITGKYGQEAESGNLLRAWDFSLPEDEQRPLWNGYARRHINAYVPRFRHFNDIDDERYKNLERPGDPGEIKTLNHIACDDRKTNVDANGKTRFTGIEALMTLKGDVDNLGLILQKGLEKPTFAKEAALSRQMNAFFAIRLPLICRRDFPGTYTVFAGGDDFFVIGPWLSTIRLAERMRDEFVGYVAGNTDIHFSAGLSMTRPGLPIRHLGRMAEEALEKAKEHNKEENKPAPKNAVSCYGIQVDWAEFKDIMDREGALAGLSEKLGLSTSYLYSLLTLVDMADHIREWQNSTLKNAQKKELIIENALWHSRFAYRTRRMLEDKIKSGSDPRAAEEKRRRYQEELAEEIASKGIGQYGAAYKIALFTHLYQQRS